MNDNPRILIVDDDIGMARTTAMILQHKGYSVSTARGGAEALEQVRERRFDMVFLDIKMPVMGGVETHRRIKEVRPEAVVMMMTAYAVEDLVQEALEDGAYGVIYKPLDIDDVVSIIEEARRNEKGALILVVDDDPATCITLKNLLVSESYQVRIAHTGEEAVAAAQGRAYDVIFVDMKLPTINGLETYLAIRRFDPQAVAIMMTGYRQEMEELVEQALQNSAYACLYKPFDIEELLRLVDEIWERKRGSRGAEVRG